MDHDAIEAVHGRILRGDPVAPSRLVELVLEPLVAFVSRAVPSITDPHEIEDCCLQALFEYLRSPHSFDPSRSRLFSWLAGKARWAALTRDRDLKRRARRENPVPLELVQDEPPAVDKGVEDTIVDVLLVHQIVERHLGEIVEEEGDLELLLLIAAGVHETSQYLETLSLPDNPKNRADVLARRERVRGRLRRLRERLQNGK